MSVRANRLSFGLLILFQCVIISFHVSCSSRSKQDERAAARARAIAKQIPLRAEGQESAQTAAQPSDGPSAKPNEKTSEKVKEDELSLDETPAALPGTDTLYSRMGGRQAIDLFVADFVPKLAADPRIKKNPGVAAAMKKADIEKFKANLASQLCALTGGPCTYSGRSMKTAHAGMKISEEEWKAMGQVFMNSLKKVNVGPKERQELARLVSKSKKDIIGQ